LGEREGEGESEGEKGEGGSGGGSGRWEGSIYWRGTGATWPVPGHEKAISGNVAACMNSG